MKRFLLGMLVILFYQNNEAQDLQLAWAKSMGGTAVDEGRSIAVDAFGNVYTTGFFTGIVDFNPGGGTFNMNSNDEIQTDVFIQKLDSFGNFLWATSIGEASFDQGYSIAVDTSGNIYITGLFTPTGNSSSDIFIKKFDTNGTLLWEQAMGGMSNGDRGFSIAVDVSGNVYSTGYFQEQVGGVPGTAEFGPFSLQCNGSTDIFIQKLDTNGDFVWAKGIGGGASDQGQSIAVDASGNIYVSGEFQSTVDFNPNDGGFNLTSNGKRDIFILKLDNDGNFIWAKSMGGSENDYGESITTDAAGNIYSTGSFQSPSASFSPFSLTNSNPSFTFDDMFMQKLNENGNIIWAKSVGGDLLDGGESVVTDNSGNVYITGYFGGTADFDTSNASFNLTSNGINDIFIQKLNTDGDFEWVIPIGNNSYDRGQSIVIDTSGSIYTTGLFRGTVDFDPGDPILNLESNGNNDIYIQKLEVDTSLSTDIIETNFAANVKLYPNPSQGKVNIKLSEVYTKLHIDVLDITGKKIESYVYENSDTISFSLNQNSGAYFVKISTDSGQKAVVKLLKD